MRATTSIVTCLVLALVGCPGTITTTDDDTADQGDDDTTAPDCVEAMEAMLQEAAASTAITVDWSAFTEDHDGNTVDPTDFASLSVAGFELLPDVAIEGICDGTIDQTEITLACFDDAINGSTSAVFDTTSMVGATLMVSVGPGQGIYSTALATVVEGATGDVIYIESGDEVPPS